MQSLDIPRLEKVRHHPSGKIVARCPACAEEGHDRLGDHLAIFPDGRFACAAHPGDGEHRRRIFALGGLPKDGRENTEERRAWIERRNQERSRERNLATLTATARAKRDRIIEHHAWTPADTWHDSPRRIDCDEIATDPAEFLASLFPASASVWTGNVRDSGKPQHKARWKTSAEWMETSDRIGPMTTPAVWNPSTFSRSAGNVRAAPFTVLDFDGFDGIKPTTPKELRRHLLDSLGMIRWLREGMDWQLAAILWTGGKSLHAWFHAPPPHVLHSLGTVAGALGMDASLIGRPEHPCRLPGQVHGSTGKLSRLLWIQCLTPPSQ